MEPIDSNGDEQPTFPGAGETGPQRLIGVPTSPPPEPTRHRLPADREGRTRHTEITWYERDETGRQMTRKSTDLYLTWSYYPDGSIAEVFVRIGHVGSLVAQLTDALCTAISIGLQCGIPIESYLSKLTGLGPGDGSGGVYYTSDPRIATCRGPLDYIARCLREERSTHA